MNKLRKYKAIAIMALILMMVSSILTGCGTKKAAEQPKEQTITDQAGRKVTIPSEINKVYFTSPIGQIMVYVLAPDKMAGWTMELSDNDKKYILPKYLSLIHI